MWDGDPEEAALLLAHDDGMASSAPDAEIARALATAAAVRGSVAIVAIASLPRWRLGQVPLFLRQPPCVSSSRRAPGPADIIAELCRRFVPPLDPESSEGAAVIARYERLLPSAVGGRRGPFCDGLPPTAMIAAGYLAAGGPDERARWAQLYVDYHRFVKEYAGHLHECTMNCWQCPPYPCYGMLRNAFSGNPRGTIHVSWHWRKSLVLLWQLGSKGRAHFSLT